MRTPNFFIVGAAKCGTTAMHRYLAQHPDIYMSRRKESLYFATDLLPEGDRFRDHEHYLELFAGARREAIVGESSVYYMLSTASARAIREYDPDARILIMLRNPVEMLHAYHGQLVFNGDEPLEDLRAALEAETERAASGDFPSNIRFNRKLLYSHVMGLTEQIARFLNAFDPSRVLVVVHDDLKRDTPGAFRRVLEFLDVDADFQPDFRRYNASKQPRSKTLRNLLKRPPRLLSAPFLIFPRELREKALGVTIELNSKYGPRRPLTAEFEHELRERFAPEVRRLGELIGRDLSHWSRPK